MRACDQQTQFGLNCHHLKRAEHPHGLCSLAVSRYSGPGYGFLDTRTPVPLKVASRLLGMSYDDVMRRAKAGEFEWFFPDNVAKRVSIFTRSGERNVTIKEAAKSLGKPVNEIEKLVATGEMKADYPEELMRIVLVTRWEAQKCPLLETGGVCSDFRRHGGHQIQCMGEAPSLACGEEEGKAFQ